MYNVSYEESDLKHLKFCSSFLYVVPLETELARNLASVLLLIISMWKKLPTLNGGLILEKIKKQLNE